MVKGLAVEPDAEHLGGRDQPMLASGDVPEVEVGVVHATKPRDAL